MKTEPAAVIGGIVALVAAIIPALVLFGVVDWSADQIGAVMLIVTTAATLAGTFFVRSKVTPV